MLDRCPHLFVMDPIDKIHFEGDSTVKLIQEAQARGFLTYVCTPEDLYVVNGMGRAKASPVYVEKFGLKADSKIDLGFDQVSIIWMRKDPPFNMDYVFATYILDLAPPQTLVLNRPDSIRNANEKMFALKWADLGPPTLITRSISQAMAWARTLPDRVVIKPWDGNGGRGVLVTHHKDPNFRSMLELLTDNENQHIVVQQYLPKIALGDKRIILIDGKPVGWMARIPSESDHRGNMHVGATVESFDLSSRDRFICDAIGPTLNEMGLLFVGIDIIGDCLTEINVTSPTGICEINPMMGISIEKLIVDSSLSRLSDTPHLSLKK